MAIIDKTTIEAANINELSLTQINEYLKRVVELKVEQDVINKLLERRNELEAKSLVHIKDRLKELEKEQDLLKRSEEAYANRNELLKLHNVLGDNELKILQNQIDLAKQGDKEALDTLKKKLEGNEKLLEGIKFTEQGQDLIIAQSRILLGLKEKENEVAKRAAEQTKATLSATTGVSDNWKNTLVGSLMEGGEEGIKKSGIAFKETFSSANIAGSLLMKVQESTIMMVKMADTTFATFNKTIGTTGELNNEIYDLSRNNTLLGFTLQETAQAYTALAGGFVDFRDLSQQNRTELAQTVTELQAIGISADVATKNISFFSKAMGLSTEQSISLSKELVAVAGALEMAPSKIASDFAAAASTLVVYGNRGIEVFKGLEAASKASGVEVSNLISIASKMDTFQGAAEAAGRLNAVLGGGLLNSSQLLMASEEERIRLVIESVQSQGVQFNDLDKYTQKAIANAAGITDMAEANKLFGMSLDSYDDYIAKTALSSEEQANLEERIQASKSAQEKFNYIMQAFAVLVMPLLDAITALVDTLMALNDATGGILPQLTTFGFVAYKAYGLLSAGAAGASLSLSGLSASITAFLTTNPVGWVLLAVAALVLLYKAFYDNDSAMAKFLDKWPLLKIYLIFVFSPLIFLISLIQRLIQFIGWATDGISKWLDRLIKGSEVLTKISEVLNKFSTGLKYFSDILLGIVSLGTLGNITDSFDKLIKLMTKKNSPALYEIADYIAAGFKNFANVITSLAIPALNMFMAPLRIIGSLMSGVWSGISTIVGATSQLFGKDNVVGIKANFDATEMLATTAAKITPDSMTNVKQLAAEVQKFNMELKTMATVTASEPLMNLVKAISATNQQMASQIGKVVLEGREIGKFVLDTINKKGNIDTAVKSTSTVT
jgi:hypothetical protein